MSGSTRFQSRPFAGGSLLDPAAAGSSAQVASPTLSADLQVGNALLKKNERVGGGADKELQTMQQETNTYKRI